MFIPESVWAKGSSNSGSLLYIFTSSHLLIFTSTHIIFTSSHLHIQSSHFTSSHLLIFTSTHTIFSSSHLQIFTSSHLILTSSYLISLSLSLSLSVSLLLFLFFLKAADGADEAPRNGHYFVRNEVRWSKIEVKLRINILGCNFFGTKWGSIIKHCGKITI